MSRISTRIAKTLFIGFAVAMASLSSCRVNDGDTRQVGTLDDIRKLAERAELNVLFILVDTLRADRLGAYGYDRETSPNLDALAETGVRFERHASQSSWTKCSMSSMWTGLYPARTGVLRESHALSEDARLPAEILLDAGYRTAAIWRNGWLAPKFGFSQGFELYHSPRPAPLPQEARQNPAMIASTDADIIRSASTFIRTHANEQWFLYLHMMDVHQYVSDQDSALFGNSYSDIYDNSIRWVDSLIGHLLKDLEALGLREQTLIVFTSDHGEAFNEHGEEGHARNVYGEVTEVPLILSFPFRLEPGIVVNAHSENVDLWPTLLELLGLSSLEDADGDSLNAMIELAAVGAEAGEGSAIAHIDQAWANMESDPQPMVAVTEGKWKLMYRAAHPHIRELFDKQQDPRESRNLANQEPARANELAERARSYLTNADSPWGGPTPEVDISDMEIEQLKAIGYGR